MGICSLSGGLSQKPHSDTIGSQQDSVQGLAWIQKEAIFEASLCIRMLGFGARPKDKRMWLEYIATPGIFVGYSKSTK